MSQLSQSSNYGWLKDMRYGDGDAPSKLEAPTSFCKILLLERAGRWEWNMQLALEKRHFCRMRLFCTLEKHACLKQNEKENVEMDLAEMPTSEIAKNPSKRASVLIFVVVRNFPHANILIFFSYLLIEHNSPSPFLPSII